MGHHEHKTRAPRSVAVALVTVSTSRTRAEDRSGPVMAELVEEAGHVVIERRIVKDGVDPILDCLKELYTDERVQAVIFSGGTGISTQDVTIEAITPFVRAWLPGFGELFRRKSYDEIGTAAMLSRAEAAVCGPAEGGRRVLVAVLPGSPNAVRLGLGNVLLPELGHLIYEIER